MTCLLILMAAVGQTEPPIAGRPMNFSHVVGRFRIAAHAEPTKVLVEAPIRLRVVITGDALERPTRKSLHIFPDTLGESFFIEPLADDDVLKDGRWEFAWNLRPKSTGVREVPTLALVYWSPGLRRYLTARSDPIAIEATAEAKSVPPAPAKIPDCFQNLAARSTPTVSISRPAFLTVLTAMVAVIAALSWRLAGSTRPRLDARRQRALAAVEAAPSDAAAIALKFLEEQLELATAEPTPAEIDAVLKRRGVGRKVRGQWIALCRGEAARRFAPSPHTTDGQAANTAKEAASLIETLEATP